MKFGIKIKSITKNKLTSQVPVYDFEVESAHHYILSGGILSHNSYVPTKEIGSGSGLKYLASTIVMLSKAKDKEDDDIVGTIITAKTFKSRFSKPFQQVKMKWDFETGMSRYYGLVDLAIEAGIFKEAPKRVELPDGTKIFEKKIYEDPKRYFPKDILDKIDEYVKVKFGFGEFHAEDEALEETLLETIKD